MARFRSPNKLAAKAMRASLRAARARADRTARFSDLLAAVVLRDELETMTLVARKAQPEEP